MKRLLTAVLLSLAAASVHAQDMTLPDESEMGVFNCTTTKYEMVGDEPVLDTKMQATISVEKNTISYRVNIFKGQHIQIVGSANNPNTAIATEPGFGIRKITRVRTSYGELTYFFFTKHSDNIYYIQMRDCKRIN